MTLWNWLKDNKIANARVQTNVFRKILAVGPSPFVFNNTLSMCQKTKKYYCVTWRWYWLEWGKTESKGWCKKATNLQQCWFHITFYIKVSWHNPSFLTPNLEVNNFFKWLDKQDFRFRNLKVRGCCWPSPMSHLNAPPVGRPSWLASTPGDLVRI